MTARTAVSGIYRLQDQAERALDTLIAGGISCSSISVLLLDPTQAKAPTHAQAEDAAGGYRTICGGADIGGTIGVLAGAGFVAILGVGRMIAAGPIMAGLAGAPTGGLFRALVGIGMSDHEAKHYERQVRGGGTLLSLSCNSAEQAARAKELLRVTGAVEARLESEGAVT